MASLIEKIIRQRITEGVFYKQYLYGTNEATILPIMTAHIDYVGGTDSQGKPSPFLCCIYRLLEIEPSEEILLQVYLDQLGSKEFKYLTTAILVYIRLVMPPVRVYQLLEPYYVDYRKLRLRLRLPEFDPVSKLPIHYKLTHMDEVVDELLTNERVFNIFLPRMVPRSALLEKGLLGPRKFAIGANEHDGGDSSDFASDSE